MEHILTKRNLCILNGISPTYIHPATGSQSATDLSICSPDIFLDMQWSTFDDMCGSGSEHYPITIHFGDRYASHANASWKLRKADWVSFADRASEQLSSGNPNISIDEFIETLISIAFDTILKSKHSVHKHDKRAERQT